MTKPIDISERNPTIGQQRCPSPACGRMGNIFQAKSGLACFICPNQNEETLEPCYTKIFYGRDATKHLLKLYAAKTDKKAEKSDPEEGGGYGLYI